MDSCNKFSRSKTTFTQAKFMNVSELQTFKSRQVLNSEVSLINVETKKWSLYCSMADISKINIHIDIVVKYNWTSLRWTPGEPVQCICCREVSTFQRASVYFSPSGYIIQLSLSCCMTCTIVRKAIKRLSVHTMVIVKYCLHTSGTSFSVLVRDIKVGTFQRAIKYYVQWRISSDCDCLFNSRWGSLWRICVKRGFTVLTSDGRWLDDHAVVHKLFKD